MGNITRDIELRHTQGGTAVTDLGIAVNDRVKKGDERVDEACFVDVTVWGKQAENVNEYLNKGSGVLVEGRLKLEEWEQDGQRRTKHKVVADKVVFLPRGGGQGNASTSNRSSSGEPVGAGAVSGIGDDIPF